MTRDLLWLTIVVALAVSWWIDNKRIEKSVIRLEVDRRDLQAEFEDKLTMLDELQKQKRGRLIKIGSRAVLDLRHDSNAP